MQKYVINEGLRMMSGAYHEVEAARYDEVGSRTVFYDDDGGEVFAINTAYVQTIRPAGE